MTASTGPAGGSPSNALVGRRPLALELNGITKEFGGVRVLDDVDLSLEGGQIHALVGENGSGKSTLVKIIAGVYRAEAGRVSAAGEAVPPSQPVPGTAFIHQDLGLVPTMSVAENISLITGYPQRRGLITWRGVSRHARKVMTQIGLELDPRLPVHLLSATEQSLVAIARALALEPRVLVLDEPTASLPEGDVATLFTALRRLREQGLAILYVSHRLDEIFRIADKVTVLRDGRRIFCRRIAELQPSELVQAITGRLLRELPETPPLRGDREILRLERCFVGSAGPVSFEVDAGEVYSLVGLRGAGHEKIGRAIFGDVPVAAGRIFLRREPVRIGSIDDAIQLGIGLVPANRREEALAVGMTVGENLSPNAQGSGWVGTPSERRYLRQLVARYDIRPPDVGRIIDVLSGGNQQKAVLGRWIERVTDLLILEEPTSGVDVGAKAEIYGLISKLLERGVAIVLISSDVEEVARIANRALIFRKGKPVSEISGENLTTEALTNAISVGAHAAA